MPRPPLFCAFDFTTGDVHYIGETPSDTKGWVYDEIFTSNSISLEAVTGNSPSRIYADNNRGNCFVIYKDGLLTVRAPQGMAVTKVEFEMLVTATSRSSVLLPEASQTLHGTAMLRAFASLRVLQAIWHLLP